MKKIEITAKIEIEDIINSVDVCNLSLIDNGLPYNVPMNFGYKDGIIYFHGAPTGRKITALRNNPNVCVSFYSKAVLNIRHPEVACSYSMKFKSVLAHGKVIFIENNKEKEKILNIVMKNYTNKDNFKYSKPALDNVNVFYLKPTEITAYRRGY